MALAMPGVLPSVNVATAVGPPGPPGPPGPTGEVSQFELDAALATKANTSALATKADLVTGRVPLSQMDATLAQLASVAVQTYGINLLTMPNATALVADIISELNATLRIFDPADYGALLNGSPTVPATGADDTDAWEDCIDAAASAAVANYPVMIRPRRINSGLSKISRTLLPPLGISFDFGGAALGMTSALDGSPGMVVGTAAVSSNEGIVMRQTRITRIGTSAGAWASGINDCCLRLLRTQKSWIDLTRLYGKTVGLSLYGDTGPLQYNKFFVEQILSNRYGIHFYSVSAGASCNQNTFYDGSYRIDTSTNNGLGARAVWFDPAGGGYMLHNNNEWINASVELQAVNADRIPWEFGCGQDNRITSWRHEANGGHAAIASGVATRNQVEFPFYSDQPITFDDQSVANDNFHPRYTR